MAFIQHNRNVKIVEYEILEILPILNIITALDLLLFVVFCSLFAVPCLQRAKEFSYAELIRIIYI